MASKETLFTRQQKYVTCKIIKDITSICIYMYIIINPLNETEHALVSKSPENQSQILK